MATQKDRLEFPGASGIAGVLFHRIIATYILGSAHVILIGASGAISGVLGIAAAPGNTRAYYWLVSQIVLPYLVPLLRWWHSCGNNSY